MSDEYNSTEVETEDDFERDEKNPDSALARRWIQEISEAEEEYKDYHASASEIIERYRAENDEISDAHEDSPKNTRYNIFWSNTENLKPAVYSKLPIPVVERRKKDSDPLLGLPEELSQVSLEYSLDAHQNFNYVARSARDDFLLVGRGVLWESYEPIFEKSVEALSFSYDEDGAARLYFPGGKEVGPANEVEFDSKTQQYSTTYDKIVDERAITEYVHWKDFIHSPARRKEELRWVGRKHYFTKDENIEFFGKEIGEKIPLNHTPKGIEDPSAKEVNPKNRVFQQSKIYEIWDIEKRQVLFICCDYKQRVLKIDKDKLNLKNFFPCSIVYATTTTESLVPRPDYAMAQDQTNELDELSNRISTLTEAIAVRGGYDKQQPAMKELLSRKSDNQMVPVDNWAAFMAMGGFKGSTSFFPFGEVTNAVQTLVNIRQSVKGDHDEITGIGDVVRGNTHPRETGKAQSIKAKFVTLRLSERQRLFEEFLRDHIAIKAEVIAQKFQPETIAAITGIPMRTEGFEQSMGLLRDTIHRDYRVSVETQSTVAADDEQEREAAIEFMKYNVDFAKAVADVTERMPEYAPLMGELLKFGSKHFRVGRKFEGIIDQTVQSIVGKGQKPDPKAQQQQQQAQQKMAQDQAKMQLDQQKLQIKAQETQAKVQIEGNKASAQVEIERFKAVSKQELEERKAQAEAAIKLRELELDEMIARMKASSGQ